MNIQIKRTYDDVSGDDGKRILVDRLWSRGISKENAHLDLWLKEIAPSTELRKWFHTESAEHWDEFKQRYLKELETNPAVKELLEIVSHHKVTLLYSAKDVEHNHAIILKEYLLEKSKS
ncbi:MULTISPECIES: DUF488 domain-containing protein [Acinetobacter]|uniref:DUF488 domain-containing protein n=2 Tax=Acinetobacter baumannii TaxID=470 RepID=A0AAP8RN35_ACIBA|nr:MULTISPECIES: DUF488 domain-containing protein [Acinetobacter]AGQ07867.1 hypothetical protein BJAB0715_03221 [Acinetobacter baumannii BJAB0715]AIY36016.1 PF04343 family protein [Acinetobacter baumannii LAC-4]AJB65932.1 uroporphyrin-III methyltransferase [Acinetobacter baumannii]AKQ29433.1 uroporphyrin-III methyltransferase [Acinetobacter baumannii]AMN02782.1 hypothetical protein AZE33_16740 [Acinetobacter baumannii]